MRRALIIAALGSVLLHGLALFSFDFRMFGEPLEPLPLVAEIRLLPPAPTPETQSVVEKSEPLPRKQPPAPRPSQPAREVPAPAVAAEAVPDEAAAEPETLAPEPTPAPAREPLLPASGYLKFVVIKESLGMQIGMAEHRWKFSADGSYRLQSRIETSGLAALFKPLRQEHESRGQMGPAGLQPIHFSVLRNGQPRGEDADFDWQAGEVLLERDGSRHPLHPGSQDVLSLNYQLAYLSRLEEGIRIGVVTGKKYEHYALDALGEEDIDTPADRFRTLHLRAAGETLTEIWLALDHQRLPVKIRFTDKKGDSYSQVLSEFGLLPQ